MPEFSTSTATTLSIAQSLLVADKDMGPITAALITEKVNIAASVVAPGNEGSVDKAAAIAELIRRYSQWIGQETGMSDSTDHEAWLGAARKKDWRYWPRYRDMLERKMSVTAVDALDNPPTASWAGWRTLAAWGHGIAAALWSGTSSRARPPTIRA